MAELEPEQKYRVEFVDSGYFITCFFKKHHRGFLIFTDENNTKIVCRPSSIRKIEKHT